MYVCIFVCMYVYDMLYRPEYRSTLSYARRRDSRSSRFALSGVFTLLSFWSMKLSIFITAPGAWVEFAWLGCLGWHDGAVEVEVEVEGVVLG